MGIRTDIEWCDSSINLMAGCDGCELYNPKNKERGVIDHCYAFYLTRRYAGSKGWPDSFDEPKIFPYRLEQIAKWRDMTAKKRPSKPWLNEMPRHIFHGDMGDYWTPGLDIDWMKPYVPSMALMPHVHMFLTKQVRRMARFFNQLGYVPDNFKLGTSVTSLATMTRAAELIGGLSNLTNKFFLSVEPLIEDICIDHPRSLNKFFELVDVSGMDMTIIVGGESGYKPREFHLEWAANIAELCRENKVGFFMKQTGSNAYYNGLPWHVDSKGSKLTDFPAHLRIRMMNYESGWAQFNRLGRVAI